MDPKLTVLGRAMTEDEAQVAAQTPLSALRLHYRLAMALERGGFTTLHRLASALPTDFGNVEYFDSAKYREIQGRLEAFLAAVYPLARIEREDLGAFVARVRRIVESFDARKRLILERSTGLWDGRPEEMKAVLAPRLGVSGARVQQLRERAFELIRAELRAGSPAFEKTMRSVCVRLLAAKQGMAAAGEWKDPASALYRGQEEACLAFAFLCRACRLRPERLATVGPGGACYESMSAQYRHDQALDAVKAVLLDAGASLQVEELRRRLAKRRLEASPEFLRRCVEVSRELGFERGGSVGLRRWEHFDAHDLSGMAHAALAAIGEVSSTEDIARKVEELYPWRAPVCRASLYSALDHHKADFVLARHGGCFALREWGIPEAGRLKDLLLDVLRLKGRVKRRELVQAALERGFKLGSVSATLLAHKELFRRCGRGEWEAVARPVAPPTHDSKTLP